jgi:hypothetical protein
VLSPCGGGVLGQIRLSDTERIAAPRNNSEAAPMRAPIGIHAITTHERPRNLK